MTCIIVAGSGFASLKLCSLLSNDQSLASHARIVLVSPAHNFTFLPLIANEVGSGNRFDGIQTDIKDFCTRRNIDLIRASVQRVDPHRKTILCDSGLELYCDVFINGAGLSKRGVCRHTYWDEYIQRNLNVERDGTTVIDECGVAEFEILSAIRSRNQKWTIYKSSRVRNRKFLGHPTLSKVSSLKDDLRSLDSQITIASQSVMAISHGERRLNKITVHHRYGINEKHLSQLIMISMGSAASRDICKKESTAQFASYSAYHAYRCCRSILSGFVERGLKRYNHALLRYEGRGEMLYVGRNRAIVWLKLRIGPFFLRCIIAGSLASYIRLLYYRIQNRLFYKAEVPAKVVLLAYFRLKRIIMF